MDRVEQAINDIRNGKMVVMVDDEDRENEGDLVFAAAFSDTQKVNFAITQSRRISCARCISSRSSPKKAAC